MIGADELRVRPLSSESEREFEALVRIYEDVLPASERKDRQALRAMLARDDCVFSIGELGGEIAGFAIRTALAATKADLLEYMGVARTKQGRGVGRALFAAVAQASAGHDRLLLLEVDSEAEDVGPAERRRRERRKAFYRELGCREVSALAYVMPNLHGVEPPRMNLLLCGRDLPAAVSKAEVRRWLEAIYAEVYGRDADDPRIGAMLSGLPEAASVI